MNGLTQWGITNGVSAKGMGDLRKLLCAPAALPLSASTAQSEAAVQNNVRLTASREGWLLFRNNSGVLKDENGRPVRYGLANDSPALNARIKSSDLIGLRPVLITSEHVGRTLGQFVALECKSAGWRKPTGEREIAQQRFIECVTAMGGHGKFTTGEL